MSSPANPNPASPAPKAPSAVQVEESKVVAFVKAHWVVIAVSVAANVFGAVFGF